MTQPRSRSAATRVRTAVSASVGRDGLRLPAESHAVLDVLLDGRRVWSIDPSRGSAGGGLRLVRWPRALRPYLDGAARVTVRDHLTGETCVDDELTFGSHQGRVRVVDAAGRPLALNKWNVLVHPFDSGDDTVIDGVLERTFQVLDVLQQECGLPAFVTYGTLLGAVRDGKLIGHDNDVDVAYLSRHAHPADVARESFRIERALRRRGWTVRRFSAGFVQVFFDGPDGATRHLDVFTCFYVMGCFYQVFHVRSALSRAAIVPLGEVTLHGRRFPAPADPEALLEATYGPGWRVPDPSFGFKTPPDARRRFRGWLEGYHVHRRYWEDFYRSKRSAAVPEKPSAFARWVGERERASTFLVDIGSGTGRDALWFARSGYQVLGLDYARSAVDHARNAAEALSASFEVLDLYDLRQVLTVGARLAHTTHPHTLYGRFLLHALEDEGRHNLWRLAELALRAGGSLYLEFRTGKDAGASHAFGEHFRRFLDPDLVVDEVEARGGHVEHREEDHGLAVYRDEDPHVCRLVVGWQR